MLQLETVPASLAGLLWVFRSCFTAPSFATFGALVVGLVAQSGRRTVCGMLVGAGLSRVWHHSRAGEPRVFRTVRYCPISGGELAVQVLVVDLVWGLVGECRVESFRIVSEFDVSRNVVDGVSAGRILATMDPRVRQDGEE